MCKLYNEYDVYYDINVCCCIDPDFDGELFVNAKEEFDDFLKTAGGIFKGLGFIHASSSVEEWPCDHHVEAYEGDPYGETFSVALCVSFQNRNSDMAVSSVEVNGIEFSGYRGAAELLRKDFERIKTEGRLFVPSASSEFRLERAVQDLLIVDEKYALCVKKNLEGLTFSKRIHRGPLACPIEKELTEEMVYEKYGRRFGFSQGCISIDFEKMLCTVTLNEATRARARIVDRLGADFDLRPGLYLYRRKEVITDPVPTPGEEIRAADLRREYPELIEKCRRETAEAARVVGGCFLEFLEGKCFYVNVKLENGETVPLSPELIEEYLEREYVYVLREDVEIDFEHWLVTIRGCFKINITNLTGDGKVLCDKPKRRKNKSVADS